MQRNSEGRLAEAEAERREKRWSEGGCKRRHIQSGSAIRLSCRSCARALADAPTQLRAPFPPPLCYAQLVARPAMTAAPTAQAASVQRCCI